MVLGVILAWLLVRRQVVSSSSLLFFAVLVPSIILHEVSHGVVALAFGDDTAKRAGRLTLNPLRHVDPIGTIVLPLLLVFAGGPAFGYAKPVPVDSRRLRSPRNQGVIVSLSGPAVNVALAVAAALTLRWVAPADVRGFLASVVRGGGLFVSGLPLSWAVLYVFGAANVVLAAFNLIPIPPLDGSAVVERVLPRSWWPTYLRFRQYSMIIVLGVVLLWPGGLSRVFHPALSWWAGLLS